MMKMMMLKMVVRGFPCVFVLLACVFFLGVECHEGAHVDLEKPLAEQGSGVGYRLHELFTLILGEVDETSSLKTLSEDEKKQKMDELKAAGWTEVEERDAVQKIFMFDDFNQAFGFMSRVALYAENMNHHPEWFNLYDKVDILITSHVAGGMFDIDFTMATHIDEIYAFKA